MIHILMIDDHSLFREAIARLLAGQPDFEVVGECATVDEGIHMLKEKPADVPAFRAFVTKCRNADGGYGVAPGQPSGAGGSYFAAIILHWLTEG